MKRFLFLLVACFCIINVQAAYLRNIPKTVNQPDGTVLHCFASGDEFFNYLHDSNGYTIMKHPRTGYYVYAEVRDGKLVATEFIAGRQDPASKGLQPYALISPEEWRARRRAWEVPAKNPQSRDYNPNHGTLNNISIFIRFSDDGEFTNTFSSIDNMFNDVSEGAVSLRSYFRAASYGAIEIPTTFYPGHNGETIISYQDTYPRSYFQPYDENTNANGYTDDNDRREREFSLLERAVNYINTNYPVPTSLNIDYDEDGCVDNIVFIVRGEVGEWSSLLWPHKWTLYDRGVYINEKLVWTFNFQLADATGYFNTSTMCHEMNHSLGAPDLYHYSYTGPNAVGIWDLMHNNTTPPQHCGAYMKMKYGHWVDEIPEITQAGTYTLNPISSSTPTNIAYKIATEDPYQFYVVEYRDKTSLFESGLPGSGLLVYRIDTRFNGNADYDPSNGIYDEVYIFRPGGNISANGNLNNAYFSSNVGRTEFSSSTSAYPFYTDGTLDYNFRIYNITSAGNTISFMYGSSADCVPPTNLVVSHEDNDVTLSWSAASGALSYNIYRDGNLIGNTSGTTYSDNDLVFGTYTYFLKSVDANGLLSLASETATLSLVPEGSILIDNGELTTNEYLPSYSYYNYSLTQQIYTAYELGGAGTITSVAFYNGGAEKTRTYEFYLKHTMKGTFSSTTDWETVTDADKVFSGSVTMAAEAWTIITFDTPFVYNGISNIVLVTDDNTGTWTSAPHMACNVFNALNQAIRVYSDNTNYNPIAPPDSYSSGEYAETLSVKNQLILAKDTSSAASFTIRAFANPEAGGTVTIEGTADEVLINESFEEYTVGGKIASSAIAAEHDWWTTWSDEPGGEEDGVVANLNGNQCAHFTFGNDQVFLLGEIDNGAYNIEFDILVPEGKNGYFNILHHFAGPNSTWAMQCYLHLTNDGQYTSSAPGHGTIHAGSNSTADIPCVYDAWMHFRLNVNINTNIARYYYTAPSEDEILLCEWPWSLDSFGENVVGTTLDAIDFFPPNDATSEFYVDNFTLTRIGTELDRSSRIFAYGSSCTLTATPNQDYTFINWTENGEEVSTESTYSFVVTEDKELVANFFGEGAECDIIAIANPTEGGTISVTGGTESILDFFDFNDSIMPESWSTSGVYPWQITRDAEGSNDSYYLCSGNGGVASSSSFISATITYPADGTVSFDLWSRGESTNDNTDWDVSRFFIDDVQMFQYGKHNDWESYSAPVSAGTHTFKWVYKKDGSVNPAGDFFGIDNVVFTSSAFTNGSTCTLTATPNYGYAFVNWTKNDSVVSTNTTYSFTVTESVTYVANFVPATFRFITEGNWSEASNWQNGFMPNAVSEVIIDANCILDVNIEVADLSITTGKTLTLQSGKTLTVTNTLTNTATTGLVIEDGAQLEHASTNVSATVKKNIAGHGTDNDKYCLISNPLVSSVNPGLANTYNLTQGTYDLYNWLASAADNLEWRNFKDNSFTMSPDGFGYLYANQDNVTLSFPGILRPSQNPFGKTVSFDSGDAEHPGWNLIGNPFVCDAYLVNGNNRFLPYYRMNAAGDGFEAVSGAVIAPMEGVFYKASGNGTVYFIRKTDFSVTNFTCAEAIPVCTDNGLYEFPAGVNSGIGEAGPDYNCLGTRPNPAWYYLKVDNPGDMDIYMYSTPSVDIDFCCWGPFTDPSEPCPNGLTSDKVVSCSYSASATEHCMIPATAQSGDYFIIVITNYSNRACNINFSKVGGSGTTDCSILDANE